MSGSNRRKGSHVKESNHLRSWNRIPPDPVAPTRVARALPHRMRPRHVGLAAMSLEDQKVCTSMIASHAIMIALQIFRRSLREGHDLQSCRPGAERSAASSRWGSLRNRRPPIAQTSAAKAGWIVRHVAARLEAVPSQTTEKSRRRSMPSQTPKKSRRSST